MSVRAITIESPIGPLRLEADEGALVGLYMDVAGPRFVPGVERLPFVPRVGAERRSRGTNETDTLLEQAADQLSAWFRGERRDFALPLRPRGTTFQQAVWEELTRIPYGETRTYRDIASRLGRPAATRAVGAANGRNPLSIVVPCHRVVGSDGTLTGYGGGLERKRWLLDHERAVIERRTGFRLA